MNVGLFPLYDSYESGYLNVGDQHELYWEQAGNPEGTPVVFLHGGPGRPWPKAIRQFFDPQIYRVIGFDQRGTWRSRPLGSVEQNTTQHLVSDIEKLRQSLGIENWYVFGGSWGSCLGLCYGISHPTSIRGMVLWGIYLSLVAENTWVNKTARWMRPAECDALAAHVGESDPMRLLRAYHDRIFNPDPAVHLPAFEIYEAHQEALSNIKRYDARYFRNPPTIAERLAEVRIALSYFVSNCFVEDGYILNNAARLKSIPGVIVHGADDMICPPSNAFDLARAWQGADLTIVPDAGHFAFEPGIRDVIVRAFKNFSEKP